MRYVLCFALAIYVCGFFIIWRGGISQYVLSENFTTPRSDCPDVLIHKGNALLLYNSTQPEVEGVNPLPFASLDAYIEYLDMQRKQGIVCPVLYLREENNAQGQNVYKTHQSPFYVEGGIPALPAAVHDNSIPIKVVDASRESTVYNQNMYAGFDPYGLYVGRFTTLDAIHQSTGKDKCSDSPMDTNWCGVQYTQAVIDSGKYKDNEVQPVIYPSFAPK